MPPTRIVNRIHKTLEDANIKLGAVASDIRGKSGRAILQALVAGERNPARLADLAKAEQAQQLDLIPGINQRTIEYVVVTSRHFHFPEISTKSSAQNSNKFGVLSKNRREMAARHPATQPQSCLAVTVICMDRGEDVRQRQADLASQGILASNVVGSPHNCVSQIRDLAVQYQVGEILVTTWMQQHEDRRWMYRRLAEEFELTARG